MNNNAIIFDLDGTLWEVTDRTYKSANEVAKKHNEKEISLETICNVFGLNRQESAKLYFPHLDLEKSLKLMAEISAVNISNLKKYGGNVYPNLENVLKILKENYDLFIVSNSGHIEYIESFLSSSGLSEYFKDYVAASSLNITKSEAIRNVINKYELAKSVYVGDTIKDLEAAQNANIPFIQAKYGFGKDLKTQYYINTIDELPSVVKNIF